MQVVSEKFAAAVASPTRKTRARLLIEWTRNATEPAVVSVSSSGQHSPTYLPDDDVANGLGESFPYAVCDQGCLADGTWFPFPEPDEAEYERGWWSNVISGSNKKFATNPYVEVTYASSAPWRRANLIRVISTTYYGRIAKFKLWYKRSTDIAWQHGTEYAMSSAVREVDLGQVLDLKAVRIEVTETDRPNDHARLIEVDAVWREDISGMVRAMTVRKRREHLVAATLPYGRYGACELDVDLIEETGKFKANGAYASYMGPNLRVLPYFGIWTGEKWEYVPQGIFYTEDDWRMDEGMVVMFSARDATKYYQSMDMDENLVSYLRTDIVFRHLAHRGHERSNNIVTDSFPDTHPYIWFGAGTIYDAIAELARAELATIYYDELGRLHIDNNDHYVGAQPIATITDSHLFGADIEEPEKANCVVYKYRQSSLAPRQEIGKSSEEIVIGAGGREVITGSFSKRPAPHVSSPIITADAGISLEYWTMSGDTWVVVVKNNTHTDKMLTGITWYGKPLSITDDKRAEVRDQDLIRRHGKRDLEIDPPIISISADTARSRATSILDRLKSGSRIIRLTMRSMPHWQHGDVVEVSSSRAGVSGNYVIQEMEIDKSNMSLTLVRL